MKNKHILCLTFMSALMAACGGSSNSGGPKVPDLCGDLSINNCNQVAEESSSSASSEANNNPPVNDLLPLVEEFEVDNSLQFFSQDYKPLLDPNPEDPNNAFYYATSGLDSGRVLAADGKLTIGNARFTIGQRLQTTGTHINPSALPADYKINTTTEASASFPTTTTWGDLDLSHPWKISFCVLEDEISGSSADNQQFMVYVDNNQTTAKASFHGVDSLPKQLSVSYLTPGKRVEINVPGDVLVGGNVVDGTSQNPGTTSSFIQLRVPSGAILTMSKLWIGYQSDTATEPAASTCTAGSRLPNWNVALLAQAPTVAPTAEANDSQLAISWNTLARASSYQLAYNTTNSVEGAALTEDFGSATTTSFNVTGLQNNQTYYVFLRAKNSAGVYTDWSPSVAATPEPASVVPAIPAAPALVAGDGQIEASWTAVESASSYTVAFNTVDNPNTASVFGAPTVDTAITLTGLTNDVPYYVFIKATNSAGDSAYSPSASATPVAPVETDWEGQVVDIFGGSATPEVGTAPTGSITQEEGVDGVVYVLRASGGVMNSSTGFRTYFASKPVSGDFQFTARIASVNTASGDFTGPGNSYGYGLMVMQNIPETSTSDYAHIPRFATMNLYNTSATTTTTPAFVGSRATKVDSDAGTRSRSDVADLTVGTYVRFQVYDDPTKPGTIRIRRFISTDGINYGDAVNSTSWVGSVNPVGTDWRIGFYGAPGSEDVFIRYDHVVLEAYDPSAASSVSSSSAVSSVASSDSSSSVASSSASSDSSSSAVSSSAASDSSSSVSSDSSVSSSADSSSSAVSSSDSSSSAAGGSSSSAAAIGWSVYNGDLHPTAANSIALADNSLDTFTYSGASPTDADFFTVASGVATFNSTTVTADKLYAQYNTVLPSSITYPRYYTGLIRAKGNGTNRVIEFDTSISDGTNGSRIKLVLRADGSNQGIQIEKADGTTSENGYSGTYDSYRIYQVAVTLTSATTGSIEVYQDGSDTPIISHAESTLLSGGINNYVRLGDGGSSAYAADIDWVIWTFDGAYKPSDLLGKLPAGLGDTTGY